MTDSARKAAREATKDIGLRISAQGWCPNDNDALVEIILRHLEPVIREERKRAWQWAAKHITSMTRLTGCDYNAGWNAALEKALRSLAENRSI